MNVNHTVIIDPELNSTMMVALGSAFNPSLPLHAPPPSVPHTVECDNGFVPRFFGL